MLDTDYAPDWRLSDTALDELSKLAGPQTLEILEVGVGASTLALRSLAPQARHTVIEDGAAHIDLFLSRCIAAGLPLPNVIYCPLRSDGYQLSNVSDPLRAYDLVLIDGPAESFRRGDPGLMSHIREHSDLWTTFVVDDTNYMREQEIVAEILRWFPDRDSYDVPDKVYTHRRTTIIPAVTV